MLLKGVPEVLSVKMHVTMTNPFGVIEGSFLDKMVYKKRKVISVHLASYLYHITRGAGTIIFLGGGAKRLICLVIAKI